MTMHVFGPFRLDVKNEILFLGSEPMSLGRRAVALLRVLVERSGEPISKEALIDAAWPGLAVEDSNLTVQMAALRRALGTQAGGEGWIETLPRRGYRFTGPRAVKDTSEQIARPGSEAAPLPIPDKPSIAVLPFENMSGDPEQEYLADAMVEDIITTLSRFRNLFVIARNSSFNYKGRTVDVRQIGRELGVRYLLEGSVRKAVNRVRITGQLIDASTGTHLWADRFEGSLQDVFELQDQVSTAVVGAIAPMIEQAEIERSKRKPMQNLEAYDYYLRGLASSRYWNIGQTFSEALKYAYKAIELDPDFASAYALALECHVRRKTRINTFNGEQETAQIAQIAQRVVEMGKDNATALCWAGFAFAYVFGDLDAGADLIDRALVLNPNLSEAWHRSGWVRSWLGEAAVSLQHTAHAMRLSPLDPRIGSMRAATASAHFVTGRYDEASSWAEKALRDDPVPRQPHASLRQALPSLAG